MRYVNENGNEVINVVCRGCGCKCRIEIEPASREARFEAQCMDCVYADIIVGSLMEVDEPEYPEEWNC
ncbi:MAG: hypothetical protein E7260_09140 [Lachnospiraceae bacterium]|nr:hypothetical protein [Lachnospiraceae bacterium]